MQSATLNLFPGAMQECAYVPYGKVAQFIPQYQGIATLAYRSSHVADIDYDAVYPGDHFEWQKGTERKLVHVHGDDRSENPDDITHVWCVITLIGGGKKIAVMNRKKVNKHRARSAAYRGAEKYNKKDSPWHTDWEAMALKTVIKVNCKTVPRSPQLAEAIRIDDAIDRPDLAKEKIIDIDTSSFADLIDEKDPPEETEGNEKDNEENK